MFYQTAMGSLGAVSDGGKYLLQAAMIGTLTQIGLIFGNLIANAVVVETVFDWPGLGSFAVNSILHSGLQRDHELRFHRHRVHLQPI